MNSALHPQLRDISNLFDGDVLTAIAVEFEHNFKRDSDSCAEWREMHAKWIEIYYQRDKTEKPFDGASQDTLPILAEACDQFHARASKAMFPARGRKMIRCVPTGSWDALAAERAERVEKHLQWQLLDSSSQYRKSKDAMLIGLPLHGTVFTKTYFDPFYMASRTENVRATDMIVPYGTGPRTIENLPRKTQLVWHPAHYARRLTAQGYYNQELSAFKDRGNTGRNPSDDTCDTIMGFQDQGIDPSDYCLVLEQHGWWDLDQDGIDEPYIIWLDAVGRQIVRVQARYETDPAGQPVAGKAAVEQFTQYDFVPNPNGIYGIGHGLKVGAINLSLNRLLRINLDASMLATIGNMSGFINKTIGIKKGEMKLEMGKFITTDTPVEDIKTQIMPFSFPGPSPSAFQIMEYLKASADRMSMVTEAVTGQTNAVMQPTAIQQLLEQSNLPVTAVLERVLMAWESELQKVYDLNRQFMPEQEVFAAYDIALTLQQQGPQAAQFLTTVARADYAADMQIKVIADPEQIVLKERLAKAQAMYEAVTTNPLTAQSPMHLREALYEYLSALDIDNKDRLVPTPEEVIGIMAIQAEQAQQAAKQPQQKAA